MKRQPETWPPAEYSLPSIDELERLSQPGGELRQQSLFDDEPRDDSRAGRLRRLLAVPGIFSYQDGSE